MTINRKAAPWLWALTFDERVPENHPRDPFTGEPIPMIEIDCAEAGHLPCVDVDDLREMVHQRDADEWGTEEEVFCAVAHAYELLYATVGSLQRVVFRFPNR